MAGIAQSSRHLRRAGQSHDSEQFEPRFDKRSTSDVLILMTMTFGLTLPRMLFERFLSASASTRHGYSRHRNTIQE
jgi:hypothetical protein